MIKTFLGYVFPLFPCLGNSKVTLAVTKLTLAIYLACSCFGTECHFSECAKKKILSETMKPSMLSPHDTYLQKSTLV